jgi:hypothetical protein
MHRRILMRMCFVLCAVMLCLVSSAAAQVNTATLTGTIRDPQGLGVKGATITLENSADGAQRTAETDESVTTSWDYRQEVTMSPWKAARALADTKILL